MLVRYFDVKMVVNGTSATCMELVMEFLAIYTLAKNDPQGVTGHLLWIMFVPGCPKKL